MIHTMQPRSGKFLFTGDLNQIGALDLPDNFEWTISQAQALLDAGNKFSIKASSAAMVFLENEKAKRAKNTKPSLLEEGDTPKTKMPHVLLRINYVNKTRE